MGGEPSQLAQSGAVAQEAVEGEVTSSNARFGARFNLVWALPIPTSHGRWVSVVLKADLVKVR